MPASLTATKPVREKRLLTDSNTLKGQPLKLQNEWDGLVHSLPGSDSCGLPATPNLPGTVEGTLGHAGSQPDPNNTKHARHRGKDTWGAGSQPDPNNIKTPGTVERRLGGHSQTPITSNHQVPWREGLGIVGPNQIPRPLSLNIK